MDSNPKPDSPVSGIGGWLALLALALCAGLLHSVIIFGADAGFLDRAWAENPDDRPEIATAAAMAILHMGINLWAISALFQKKRSFRTAFVAFWIVSVVEPLSTLLFGFDMHEIVRALGSAIIPGLWFVYICVSARVRNTLVN